MHSTLFQTRHEPQRVSLFGPVRNLLTLQSALGVVLLVIAVALNALGVVDGTAGYFVALGGVIAAGSLIVVGLYRRETGGTD